MVRKEAVVVCGEKVKAGLTVSDLETGDLLRRIPSCASPPHGLLCLHNRFVVASQLRKDRPFGCGAIFIWPLTKSQAPQVSYTMEAIGPITSSRDGVYLVGGSSSGNAYIWEVTSGRLLKNWHAHQGPLSCLTFSHDSSFLISGSADGTICIWSMISLLATDVPQRYGSSSPFRILSEHGSCITGLLSVSCGSSSGLISSSIDRTCKVWDIVSGILLQSHVFSVAVTAIAIDPGEQLLFAGRVDGRIYINVLHLGLQEQDQITISEEESGVLHAHEGPVTALSFNSGGSCLISASENWTVCLWDATSWQVIRRLTHGIGHVTNLLVIPLSSLSMKENQKNRIQARVPLLDKTTQPSNRHEGTLTLLPGNNSHANHLFAASSQADCLLKKQILDSEYGRTPEMLEMKIETSIEDRLRILNKTKHMNFINQHLRSWVIDMMQCRLCNDDSVVARPRNSRAMIDDTNGSQES